MLEETLSSSSHSPAEAAMTFISFIEVELTAGGAAAEARFFKLFSMLCDRVFGSIAEKEGFNHEVGGWLSRHAKWERPSMTLSSPQKTYGMHRPGTAHPSSVTTDPVVRLMGARKATSFSPSRDRHRQQPLTLIEAFAKEAEHRPNIRYAFPFQALPKSTQDAWIYLIETALNGLHAGKEAPLENTERLLGSILRVKPLEQTQLRHHQQHKIQKKDALLPLQLSPVYAPGKSPLQASSASKEKDASPKIMLSMLEYYLVLFLRYPLAPPPVQQTDRKSAQPRGGHTLHVRRSEPYGDTVYYQLFQEYVSYYVPVSKPQSHTNGFVTLERPSDLFVNIIAEFWLNSQNQLASTEKSVTSLQDRKGPAISLNLNASFDLVKTSYKPPPFQTTRCLHKLIERAVSDGALFDLSRDVHLGYKGSKPEILCLSPTMATLQLSFYNYVRSSFRYASIHAKQSPFYAALNHWLLWLEPWNTRHCKYRVLFIYLDIDTLLTLSLDTSSRDPTQRIMNSMSRASNGAIPSASSRVNVPRPNQRSMYREEWEPYIASNLYLYVVPFAIFIRRARELDFSPREYKRSLNTVSRVFRVFSPKVVAVITKLLKSKGTEAKYSEVVSSHEKKLGRFAPPSTSFLLSSCQDDMHNLLEEIHLQHTKKVEELDIIDRFIASIEGFFGQGAYSGEEKELSVLIETAKVIVGFPKSYEVAPKLERRRSRTYTTRSLSLDVVTADRSRSGMLTEAGRSNLLTGVAKCDPSEVAYIGDKLYARPQSYELGFLVPLTIHASNFVNTRLGIRTEGIESYVFEESIIPKRFNFRFLADYRNIILLSVGIWLWQLMRS